MAQAVDYEAVKSVQREVWSKGDFAKIASRMAIVGESLCEAVEVTPGDRVLDVACGSGNVALAASRRFADTVGVDYVPSLLEHGRERAQTEGLDVEFVEGDAEALPFEDASFDVVLSTFGAMFAPNQQKAANELLRVCRPGGRIGMGNWTPDGMVGEMFKIVTSHAPPPAKLDPPVLWGVEQSVRQLFGDGISEMRCERKYYNQRSYSPEHFVTYFRTWFGPTKAAFERLDAAAGAALADDLLEMLRRHNMAGDRALVAPAAYLEIVATRSG
jgi:ubiquinone/menaquinone biosynthesis C-methylase UbiE